MNQTVFHRKYTVKKKLEGRKKQTKAENMQEKRKKYQKERRKKTHTKITKLSGKSSGTEREL